MELLQLLPPVKRHRYGLYLCHCGTVFRLRVDNAKSGHTKSCGCLAIETAARLAKRMGLANRIDGRTGTREYRSWIGMKRRCENPADKKYYAYGARGIKVMYKDYEEFLRDVGLCPGSEYTIDRINNNGHYEVSNCRWATYTEQNNNRRPYSEWAVKRA